ncbi:hypothetical protein EDC04DRAFT_2895051 [Pisolithus marmoratus]|nr:hypothetical protein EDC04DRAFT_2895051 [Pisolithus marmoratus]
MSLYSSPSASMPSSSVTNGNHTSAISSVTSQSATLLSLTSTLYQQRSSIPGASSTTHTSNPSPGHISSADTSSTRSPTPSSTSGIATPSSGSTLFSQVGALPDNNTPIQTVSLSQGHTNAASTATSLSNTSQSPSQVNTPFNQSGHTTSVGLITALSFVGGLLAVLMTYFTLRYRRPNHRHRASSPSINSVLSTKEVALSPPSSFESRASRSAPLSIADTGRFGDCSVSASAEASPAQDTNSCDSMCSQDSKTDARLNRTSPSSEIGLAL